jgi:arylformamidase
MSVYDVTQPLRRGMSVWPGDPAVEVTIVTKDTSAVVSSLAMGSHSGTHVDAPRHFIPAGRTVSDLSLDLLVGTAEVRLVRTSGVIRAADLAAGGSPLAPRLILKTDWEPPDVGFDNSFPGLDESAAGWLLTEKVALVGIDSPSIEPFGGSGNVHRMLLGADVIIVEGLLLRSVPAGQYLLQCLPLLIANADGAPARVLLRSEGAAK